MDDDGVKKLFKAKLTPAQRRKPWKAQFVLSTEQAESLPKSMAEKDLVRHLCFVSVDVEGVHRVVRNKHWWNFGERYELGSLVVKLIPGHADLRFRLLSAGRLLNSEEDRVEVNWGVSGRPASVSSADELDQMYL